MWIKSFAGNLRGKRCRFCISTPAKILSRITLMMRHTFFDTPPHGFWLHVVYCQKTFFHFVFSMRKEFLYSLCRMEIKFNHMNLWGLSIVVCGILRQLNITKVFLSMFWLVTLSLRAQRDIVFQNRSFCEDLFFLHDMTDKVFLIWTTAKNMSALTKREMWDVASPVFESARKWF